MFGLHVPSGSSAVPQALPRAKLKIKTKERNNMKRKIVK